MKTSENQRKAEKTKKFKDASYGDFPSTQGQISEGAGGKKGLKPLGNALIGWCW